MRCLDHVRSTQSDLPRRVILENATAVLCTLLHGTRPPRPPAMLNRHKVHDFGIRSIWHHGNCSKTSISSVCLVPNTAVQEYPGQPSRQFSWVSASSQIVVKTEHHLNVALRSRLQKVGWHKLLRSKCCCHGCISL